MARAVDPGPLADADVAPSRSADADPAVQLAPVPNVSPPTHTPAALAGVDDPHIKAPVASAPAANAPTTVLPPMMACHAGATARWRPRETVVNPPMTKSSPKATVRPEN
jgi:hypothetical protein